MDNYTSPDGKIFTSRFDDNKNLIVDGEGAYAEWLLQKETSSKPTPPTPQEDADAMLVDHEYRLTLLELGVN